MKRGQAIVIFAMFLLVLALLVLATMSLSRLTHEKMELQVANDTAAYSQAVATARAYNSVALLNRAQVATMVALSGVDSAVSFGGAYRASLNATWYGYVDEFDKEYCGKATSGPLKLPRKLCGGEVTQGITGACEHAKVKFVLFSGGLFNFHINWPPFECAGKDGVKNSGSCRALQEIYGVLFYTRAVEEGASTDAQDALNQLMDAADKNNDNARLVLIRKELTRVKKVWQALDDAAGLQARSVQSEAAEYGVLQDQALAEARAQLVPFAKSSLAVVNAAAVPQALTVAKREFDDGAGDGMLDNSVDAAMGSRAHTFITQRADGARAIQDQLRRVLSKSNAPAGEVTVLAMKGNGYFATSKIHGARPATGYGVWGDEEARVRVNYLGPGNVTNAGMGRPGIASGNQRFEGWVGSTDKQNTTDLHDWCPQDIEPEAVAPDVRHTMLPHAVPAKGIDPCAASSCIWPSFRDANAGRVDDKSDVFGQPKLFSSATRDLSGQNDALAIERSFKFKAGSGAGAKINFKAEHAVAGVDQHPTSIAAGMAYYHRPGHWKEPPNLFNPYWRATLVRSNIDAQSDGDLPDALTPQAADTLKELKTVGFEGIP